MVRLGLIGAGVIGKRHIGAIRASGAARLVAVADISPTSAGLAQENDAAWFCDAEAMFDAARPDGVIVATPTEHHLLPTLGALSRQIPVLVEKLIAATVVEANRIAEMVKQTGCPVLVGHQRRYYDCVAQAQKIVRSGDIGTLIAVSGQWLARKHDSYYDPDWRKRQAAGPVLTNLIHEIDSLRAICGEIVEVAGFTANHVQGFEKEDAAAIALRFSGGALGTFVLSDQALSPWGWNSRLARTSHCRAPARTAWRLAGTRGALEFPNLVLWSGGPGADWTTPLAARPIDTATCDPYVSQIRHFAEVIQHGVSPMVTAEDGVHTLAATVAIFEAMRTGAKVTL